MKRKLVLAMASKILHLLQDNEAQLLDIDYADDCDHCDVKTTVYKQSNVRVAWWMSKHERAKSNLTTKPDELADSQPCGMSHSDVHDAHDTSPRKRLKRSRTATRRKRSTMSGVATKSDTRNVRKAAIVAVRM